MEYIFESPKICNQHKCCKQSIDLMHWTNKEGNLVSDIRLHRLLYFLYWKRPKIIDEYNLKIHILDIHTAETHRLSPCLFIQGKDLFCFAGLRRKPIPLVTFLVAYFIHVKYEVHANDLSRVQSFHANDLSRIQSFHTLYSSWAKD